VARPILGIDIGGSGIKAAPVDLTTGELTKERVRIPTPQPSVPDAVAEVVASLADRFAADTGAGPIGITFPTVVKHGITKTAANVDPAWIDLDAAALFRAATGRPCFVVNDAQAAAIAEVRFGAAKGQDGIVLLLTFGTGIGSGLVIDGRSVEGVELGHLRIDGKDAEDLAAASVRDNEKLGWKEWSRRVNTYLDHVETVLWVDLIVLGGGVSEKADKWVPRLKTRAPNCVAELRNDAGIVGAALYAADLVKVVVRPGRTAR
jgi:polyphosphate glucokinase